MSARVRLASTALLVLGVAAACTRSAATSRQPTPGGADREAWRRNQPTPGEPSHFSYPSPQIATLANGFRVYLIKRPGGLVLSSVTSRRGASALPLGKSGLAALTVRMMTEGTRRRSSLELAEAAEALGSTLQSDAGRDYAEVSLATLREDVRKGLELLAEVVHEPVFSPKELERVRGEVLDGLRAERQEPRRLASLAALRLLLGPTEGAPVGGSIPDVERLTTNDLASFHAAAFLPQTSALIVAGDVTLAELQHEVERLFGAARPAPQTTAPPFEPPKLERNRVVVIDRPDAVQTALFVAQPFPKRSEPGYEARELLSGIVGGLFTSRINQNLREKHAFTYGATSQAIAARSWGAFVVTTSVETPTTADAVEQIVIELKKARDPKLNSPIASDELERARADAIHTLGAHLEHVSHMADDLQTMFVHDLPADYDVRFPEVVTKINREQITREAERLTPDRLVIVAVGDKNKLLPELEAHGLHAESADARLTE